MSKEAENLSPKGIHFSIATVVFNEAEGLRRTAESVLKQRGADYDWIIIDGASTDGTLDVIQELPQENLCWKTGKDKGIYDAMNHAIDLSTGDFVVFMNAGDEFSQPDTLAVVAKAIEQHPDVDLVLGGADIIGQTGKTLFRPARDLETYLWHSLPAIHQSIYFRRSRLDHTQYDIRFRVCGDYDLVCRLYKEGVTHTNVNVSLARFYSGGTSSNRRGQLCREALSVQERVLKLGPAKRWFSWAARWCSMTAVRELTR